MKREIWKDIPGFGGHYMASSRGRIKAKKRVVTKRHWRGKIINQTYQERILNPAIDAHGYVRVHLGVDGGKKKVSVHHLVLFAFVGPCPLGMEACHGDNNPSNNAPDNLRWDTHHNNNQDRKRAGNYAIGEKHPMSKYTDKFVDQVRAMTLAEARNAGVSKGHFYRIKHAEPGRRSPTAN